MLFHKSPSQDTSGKSPVLGGNGPSLYWYHACSDIEWGQPIGSMALVQV